MCLPKSVKVLSEHIDASAAPPYLAQVVKVVLASDPAVAGLHAVRLVGDVPGV